MAALDDFGKALEAELERLRRFLSEEFVPHTRRAAIEALRTAGNRLEELATDLEARTKTEEKPSETQPGDKANASPR